MMRKLMLALTVLSCLATCVPAQEMKKQEMPLAARVKRFSPTVITGDTKKLMPSDRQALAKIIAAAKLFDPLFLRQVWSGNAALLARLEADKTPAGRERLHYFLINDGPWSQLDDNVAFLEGVPAEKPPTAAHYPDGMSKEEFEAWVAKLSPADKEKATGFFYAIRRDAAGKLKFVPYSEEYKEWLAPAAKLLREAAALTPNLSLKRYLKTRADAFMSNDYYESDVAWMELDAPIDVTIGPYETYSDGYFGYKAAFEAYVTLRDEAESQKLKKFGGYLQGLEDTLPIEPRFRNPKLGAGSPIRVVNVVFSSGEGNSGVQTAAFNLPNDERIVSEKGSKRVLLKNTQEAKFAKTLLPISRQVLSPAAQRDLSFEAFFTHILCHELMHGLGPQEIVIDGKKTTVRQQLKDTYGTIEEAKADISGLWALQQLVDKGELPKTLEKQMYTTFLASIFRSVRFGINESHGRGVAIQFNYLTDEGALKFDPKTVTFSIVPDKIKSAVTKLTHDIMTIQATGDYAKAKQMRDGLGVIRPNMQSALDKLSAIPVDIEPLFPLANAAK